MSLAKVARVRIKSVLSVVVIVLVLSFLALLAVRLITGRSLGLRSLVSSGIQSVSSLARAVIDSQRVRSYTNGEFTNVIFLHHSVGYNLVEEGGVRDRLAEAGYNFWDHGYNWNGLRGPDGSPTGYSYNIPDDNTDPDGLARVFAQRAYGISLNAFSGLLQHEVIGFKSCFPVSHISSDGQLERYKSYYLAMRDVMDQHPDRIFIVVTAPPLNPAETNAEAAARARAFANWLKSDAYLGEHPNIFAFDLFGYLAQDDPTLPDYNTLRKAYREESDSHPNQTANEKIGPLFVDFIIDAVQRYRAAYESMVFSRRDGD